MIKKMCYNPMTENGILLDELVGKCVMFHNDQEFHQMNLQQQMHHMPHTDTHTTPRQIYLAACSLVRTHHKIADPIIKKLRVYKADVSYHNIDKVVPKVKKLFLKLRTYGLAESSNLSFKRLEQCKSDQKAYYENFKALIDLIILDIK